MPTHVESWYAWKCWSEPADGEPARLLTPWADPMKYEFPYDFLFASVDEARQFKADDDAAAEEDWILVEVTYRPVQLTETVN